MNAFFRWSLILIFSILSVTPAFAKEKLIEKRFNLESFEDFPESAKESGRSKILINRSLFKEKILELNLSADLAYTAIQERIEKFKGHITWIGKVEGDPLSSVTLTLKGRALSGSISAFGRNFHIQYSGSKDGQLLFESDPNYIAPGEDMDAVEAEDASLLEENVPVSQDYVSADSSIVDVLVLYTPAAAAKAGGIDGVESRILNGIADSNAAYANSNISLRMNLAHMQQVDYVESGDMSSMLSALRSKTDGVMDEIHALRDQYGADIVSLITDPGSSCGIAYVMTTPRFSFESSAFSITGVDCFSQFTFTHEIGHNFGSGHNREDGSYAAYNYSWGYRYCNDPSGYRTVMSYSCSGAGRVLQFSNPNVSYNGLPTGIADNESLTNPDAADNARSINETKLYFTQFRESMNPIVPNTPALSFVSAISDNAIELIWADNSSNESGFEIERSTDQVSWSTIATLGINVTSFVDSGLAHSQMYYYRLRAWNGTGYSSYSNVMSAETQGCVRAAPTLSLSASSNFFVPSVEDRLSIDLINNDSLACGPSDFHVFSSDGSSVETLSLGAGESRSGISYVFITPAQDGVFSILIHANSNNHSVVDKSINLAVDGTAPSAPVLSYAITGRKQNGVSLSWTESLEEGSGLKEYQVYRNGVLIASTLSLSFSESSLAAGAYDYMIMAIDRADNTISSNSVSVTIAGKSTGKPSGGDGTDDGATKPNPGKGKNK